MEQQNVLVTGASTGIGRRIAEYLAEKGFQVFAGARKEADILNLSSINNVQGIKLEVTDAEDIKNCVTEIDKAGGLFALVNNAGILIARPLIEMTEEEYTFQLNVNLIAINELVKAFFDQLRNSTGRIVNISSLNGFIPSPFGGAYSITKFGLISYSEQLRAELRKFDIEVSCVEPGYFHSAIFGKSDETREQIKESTKYYKEEYEAERVTTLRDDNIKDPITVAQRVYHSLTAEKSYSHYTVGNKIEEGWAFQALLNRILQVNEGLDEPWSFEELQQKFNDVKDGKMVW